VGHVDMSDGRVEITVSDLPVSSREDFVAGFEGRDDVVGLSYDVT